MRWVKEEDVLGALRRDAWRTAREIRTEIERHKVPEEGELLGNTVGISTIYICLIVLEDAGLLEKRKKESPYESSSGIYEYRSTVASA